MSSESAARSAPTAQQPTRAERLATVLRFPYGMVVTTGRYLRHVRQFHRTETAGGPSDLPPPLPPAWVDGAVKTVQDGYGPLYHRTFSVRMVDADVGARDLVGRLAADLDRAAPSEVVTFRKLRGELGGLAPGDEYLVRIPAPWDGPVRVVERTATSFRFTTLRRHLEAGQIEFRARDEPDAPGTLTFTIESWSRAGTPLARQVFSRLRVGKEVQLSMWAQFCLAVPGLVGARRVGPVGITTRRWDRPATR